MMWDDMTDKYKQMNDFPLTSFSSDGCCSLQLTGFRHTRSPAKKYAINEAFLNKLALFKNTGTL